MMSFGTFGLVLLVFVMCIMECKSLLSCQSRMISTHRCRIDRGIWKINNLNRRFANHDSSSTSADLSTNEDNEAEAEDTEEVDPRDDDLVHSAPLQAEEESKNDDPHIIAQRELEKELKSANDLLRKEQSELFDIQEKLFESGKNGYLLVQAQINDFSVSLMFHMLGSLTKVIKFVLCLQKKRQAEQAKKIEEIKKKVVEKIAPLLESFRAVPTNFPAETEREKKMHGDFAVLVKSITIALKKCGYEEPPATHAQQESSIAVAN